MPSPTLMPDDRRRLTLRLTVIQYIIAVLFAALAVGFWIFQIAEHEKFAEMAAENHQRRLPLPAPRGVLFDRNGKILVDNQNSFNIALLREQTRNLDQTLHTLAVATGAHRDDLRHRGILDGAGHRGARARMGASRHRLARGAVAALSGEPHGGSPV